jgi:biofilm PGA synthesis N-glycosyltransferase PgaC
MKVVLADTGGKTKYVLITPAYNEEAFIERTIRAVISQTLLPLKWIIVSDASTDQTEAIVHSYLRDWPFIELRRMETAHGGHSFASKVFAFDEGVRSLGQTDFNFIGNLDADVSFCPSYFEDLLLRFRDDEVLGIAGGWIYELNGETYAPRRMNTPRDVAGAVQMFRRECYESVGGLLPLECGGEDWCAQVTARMKNWRVRSFPEITVYHHRITGESSGRLRRRWRQGLMDFSMGTHPASEVIRLLRRLGESPAAIGAAARLCGYVSGYLCGQKRLVSDEVVRFLRREELQRVRGGSRMIAEWVRRTVGGLQ